MRSQGATREEIRTAVREMLEGWGIEVPERPGEGHPGGHSHGRGRGGGFWADLTEEQREAIHEKREELRSQGATREEIHAAIREMLEGYGVELPNHPGSTSGGTSSSEEMSASSGTMSSEGTSTDFILQTKSYPNPFSRETGITYTLNAPADVRVQIHNVAGRLVRNFEMGAQQPGTYSVHWDGTYENGAPVTSGVYFYQIKAGTQTISKPMILLTLK